jgi:hypothetical protein
MSRLSLGFECRKSGHRTKIWVSLARQAAESITDQSYDLAQPRGLPRLASRYGRQTFRKNLLIAFLCSGIESVASADGISTGLPCHGKSRIRRT